MENSILYQRFHQCVATLKSSEDCTCDNITREKEKQTICFKFSLSRLMFFGNVTDVLFYIKHYKTCNNIPEKKV